MFELLLLCWIAENGVELLWISCCFAVRLLLVGRLLKVSHNTVWILRTAGVNKTVRVITYAAFSTRKILVALMNSTHIGGPLIKNLQGQLFVCVPYKLTGCCGRKFCEWTKVLEWRSDWRLVWWSLNNFEGALPPFSGHARTSWKWNVILMFDTLVG